MSLINLTHTTQAGRAGVASGALLVLAFGALALVVGRSSVAHWRTEAEVSGHGSIDAPGATGTAGTPSRAPAAVQVRGQ